MESQKGRSRYLLNDADVFTQNAWDDIHWDEQTEERARLLVSANSADKVCGADQEKFEKNADEYWDDFYAKHRAKFFKDRSWLLSEFYELYAPTNNVKRYIFDVGCGVGNTTIPILKNTAQLNCFVYACDFSKNAVAVLKQAPEYDTSRCFAFPSDVTLLENLPFRDQSIDFILLIFVLSAISPHLFQSTLSRLKECLKPGGMILFRDYGQYDMAQLRFKNGKCLSENFYVRSDGTRAYFFKQEELRSLFISTGFQEVENIVDRRLIVNRKRHLKMYRVWMQCKYRKPLNQ